MTVTFGSERVVRQLVPARADPNKLYEVERESGDTTDCVPRLTAVGCAIALKDHARALGMVKLLVELGGGLRCVSRESDLRAVGAYDMPGPGTTGGRDTDAGTTDGRDKDAL